MPPSLSFFRDHCGFELDLLLETVSRLVAVEAKSGRTASGDFLEGIDRFAELLPEREAEVLASVVIYGGDARQEMERGLMLPWSQLDAFDWGTGALQRRRRTSRALRRT